MKLKTGSYFGAVVNPLAKEGIDRFLDCKEGNLPLPEAGLGIFQSGELSPLGVATWTSTLSFKRTDESVSDLSVVACMMASSTVGGPPPSIEAVFLSRSLKTS